MKIEIPANRAPIPGLEYLTQIGDEPQLLPTPGAQVAKTEVPTAGHPADQPQEPGAPTPRAPAAAETQAAQPRRRGRPPKVRSTDLQSAAPAAGTQRVSLILPAELHRALKTEAARKTLASVQAGGEAVSANDLIVDAVRRILA